MKFVRYGPVGYECPGLIDPSGDLRDLSGHMEDITPSTIERGELERLRKIDPETLRIVKDQPRLGSPVARPGKIVCIGLNYRDHAAESGLSVPDSPTVFLKSPTALCGPRDAVVMPRRSQQLDWEVELAVVISRKARYVDHGDALNLVAGYCVTNDVSERSFSEEGGGQWTKGKSFDTFAPLGPYLVTPDEVPDPQNLKIWLKVNERLYQSSYTLEMVFSVADLISYVSRFMTLMPGDILNTGTPGGVGLGQHPPVFLKPHDVMTLGIEGLGEQVHEVVREQSDQAGVFEL